MKVFWLSWYAWPIDDPEVASTWPPGVKGWITGSTWDREGRDVQVWCARVEADDAEAARGRILELYGRFADKVEWRFGPSEYTAGWWPDASRFPR